MKGKFASTENLRAQKQTKVSTMLKTSFLRSVKNSLHKKDSHFNMETVTLRSQGRFHKTPRVALHVRMYMILQRSHNFERSSTTDLQRMYEEKTNLPKPKSR